MAGHAGAHHRNYLRIYLTLLGLLVVSVVGPMFGIVVLTLITAFGVAVIKAYLVAKNFMHLDVEKPIVHWMLALSVVLMVLMFAGLAPDVMKSQGRRWEKGPGWHVDKYTGAHHGDTGHAAPGAAKQNSGAPAGEAGGTDHGNAGGH